MVRHAPVPVRVVCGFVPWPPVCIGELTRVVPNRFTASHAIAVRKTAVDLQSGQVGFAATLSRMMENWHYLTPTGNSMAARNLRDAREVGTAAEPHLFRAVERRGFGGMILRDGGRPGGGGGTSFVCAGPRYARE
mgnify:CR=1 FL=1